MNRVSTKPGRFILTDFWGLRTYRFWPVKKLAASRTVGRYHHATTTDCRRGISLLLASVLIATNLDGGSDAGALPEHPTAPPPPPPTPTPRTGPRPALPTPRPASPPGARPSIIPSPPLLPTRPPTPAQTPVVTDRFGTVLGPERVAVPVARPLPPGTERVRFTSEDGGFSFLHPVGWTIERLEDTHLGSTWRLHNTRPGTRPGSVADDAVRIDITFSEDATEQDPATGDVSSARSLEQLVSEVSVPPQFGFLRP